MGFFDKKNWLKHVWKTDKMKKIIKTKNASTDIHTVVSKKLSQGDI